MHPRIRDLAGPGRKVRFHLRPGGKAAPGDRVPLDVADATLVLALGARPIRCAGADTELPMARECVQPGMQHHLTAGRVVVQDQRLGSVEQNVARHAAERPEGALQSIEPTFLPLVTIRPHMQPARVAEGRDEEKDFDRDAIDLNPAFTKVDLQLLTRMGLKPHRRTRCGNQLAPQRSRRTLDRSQADNKTFLRGQVLANHIGIAGMAAKPLGNPVRQTVQLLRPGRRRTRAPITFRQPATHRVARATKLRRNPLRTPTQRLQPQHRRDLIRRLHRIPPLIVHQQGNIILYVHPNLLQRSKGVSSDCRQGGSLTCHPTDAGGLSVDRSRQ